MGIFLKQGERSSTIRLDGAIDISLASELKALLLKALETGGELHLSLAEATALDVTAMQLLWAAKDAAKASGVGFVFTGPMPGPVSECLSEAGLGGLAAIVVAGERAG